MNPRRLQSLSPLALGLTGVLFAGLLLGCSAPPKPESVTLVRVDGGFMSCTTFLSAPGPDGGR